MGASSSSYSNVQNIYNDMAAVTVSNMQKCSASSSQTQNVGINVANGCNFSGNTVDISQSYTLDVNCFMTSANIAQLQNDIKDTLSTQANAQTGFLSSGTSNATSISNNINNISNSVTTQTFQNCSLLTSVNQNVNINLGGGAGTGGCNFTDNTFTVSQMHQAVLNCYSNNSTTANAATALSADVTAATILFNRRNIQYLFNGCIMLLLYLVVIIVLIAAKAAQSGSSGGARGPDSSFLDGSGKFITDKFNL